MSTLNFSKSFIEHRKVLVSLLGATSFVCLGPIGVSSSPFVTGESQNFSPYIGCLEGDVSHYGVRVSMAHELLQNKGLASAFRKCPTCGKTFALSREAL